MTKEQASDLKSHIERYLEVELTLQRVSKDCQQAKSILHQFIYDLEHPKQGA